jgi:DNA-directed RNA polymerase specialized sigma subunit
VRRDESKEELQSYYNLKDEDMEQIMKEWLVEFLVSIDDAELSNPDIIGIPLVTQFDHAGETSVEKKKKKEEV